MDSDALKAKIWMWGPFIVFALVFTILILVVFNLDEGSPGGVNQVANTPIALEEQSLLEILIADYLAANGGEETLASLQSARFSGRLETDGETIPYVSIKKRPSQSHLSLQFPNYKLSLVVDGESVWQRVSVEGQSPINTLVDDEDAREIRRLGLFFDPVTMVLLLDQGTIDDVAEGFWEGSRCLILEFENRSLGIDSTAYIDSETMHVLARVDRLKDGSVRTLRFSQYTTVDGFQHAFSTETYLDGDLENRVVIESARHNIGTFSSFFEFPENAEE
jgi:hypothetical protein